MSCFLLLLLGLLLVSTTFTLPVAPCHDGDRAALLKIKKDLGNPPQLKTWLPNDTDCCRWYGILCFSDPNRVDALAIDGAELVDGSVDVPAAIGDLSQLGQLSLNNMPGLRGPLPPSIANLSHLFALEITGTSVSGPIPDFLANTGLSMLILSNNQFEGPIPRALSRLALLRHVDLSHNRLNGSIPPGLLHQDDQVLFLSGNSLTGEIPKSYGGSRNLSILDVSNNQLTGSALFLLNKTNPARVLALGSNKLDFDLTEAEIPLALEELDLSHNRIRGAVPSSINDAENLVVLNLSYNRLCGKIPWGRIIWRFDYASFNQNKCLCGKPTPPCKR